jgi:hypothetical protein
LLLFFVRAKILYEIYWFYSIKIMIYIYIIWFKGPSVEYICV